MPSSVIDQMGYTLNFPSTPKRIISLVPSITELLVDLGLEKNLVGITKFCIHPKEKLKAITKIGGTKNLDLAKIRELKPDLIIGNKEENTFSDILDLKADLPVWMTDINTLEDAYQAIAQIGQLTNTEPEAKYLLHLIEAGFRDLQQLAQSYKTKSACYCIWKDPYLAAGTHTFIHAVLEKVGFKNVITEARYPEFNLKEIEKLKCNYLFLSSEPYPFAEKHRLAIQEKLTHTQVVLVDGEMFSWYGSRLVKAIGYFFQLQKSLFS